MSVPRTGTGAYAWAGTAGIDSSYGRQVGVMEDGQLQGQPALYVFWRVDVFYGIFVCSGRV